MTCCSCCPAKRLLAFRLANSRTTCWHRSNSRSRRVTLRPVDAWDSSANSSGDRRGCVRSGWRSTATSTSTPAPSRRERSAVSFTRSGLFMSASLHHPKQPAATSKALLSSVVLAALVTAMGPARLGAHDLWIVPSSFVVAPGQLLRLHLRIGDQEGEPFPRSQELLVRFDASTRGGPAQTIPGIDGGNPAGFFRPMSNGIWSIAYESVANRSSLDPDSFHRYLREEPPIGVAS